MSLPSMLPVLLLLLIHVIIFKMIFTRTITIMTNTTTIPDTMMMHVVTATKVGKAANVDEDDTVHALMGLKLILMVLHLLLLLLLLARPRIAVIIATTTTVIVMVIVVIADTTATMTIRLEERKNTAVVHMRMDARPAHILTQTPFHQMTRSKCLIALTRTGTRCTKREMIRSPIDYKTCSVATAAVAVVGSAAF
ncbi:hypothetical protein L228DRAFT_35240 [Xylona heveae TC161]|uniref:Uncharacterized protein n=1 Tax=Xylona heveae (strain CBS 132557 / TC161) TaxID=1328760 RepID=A0A165A7Y2_XYLHT|nr:hypothetical protein L228DRAFT_35240 [Xylona heveae TC161]KZF20079.1 hypothetical protein L228DRAFT_35240 [Xylona heveae TC161]